MRTKKNTIVLGYEGDFPIISCERSESGLKFYCEYCKRIHLHGLGEGHRSSHCSNKESHLLGGYILKLVEVKEAQQQ